MLTEDQLALAPMLPAARPSRAYREAIACALTGRRSTLDTALAQLSSRSAPLVRAAEYLVETLRCGHKVLVAGNGGSAAEAQHFAAELVGRFKRERKPYAVLALTTDTSILTAVANDYGYDEVFARQVRAFGRPDDLLIAFSTSGNSPNVVAAVELARLAGAITIALTGHTGGRLKRLAHLTVRVPADASEKIEQVEDAHLAISHSLCVALRQRLRGRRHVHPSVPAATMRQPALTDPVPDLIMIELPPEATAASS